MAKQNVYTKTQEDYITGEVQSKTWVTKEEKNTETFMRSYVQDIGKLARCSGAEISVVLGLLPFVEYDTNEIALTTSRRKALAETLSLSSNTINTAISRLQRKNILCKHDGTLFLNAQLFFLGSELKRNALFELKITYRILEDVELERPRRFKYEFSKVQAATGEE